MYPPGARAPRKAHIEDAAVDGKCNRARSADTDKGIEEKGPPLSADGMEMVCGRVRPVVHKRWRHAHLGRLRDLGRVWLWQGALLGVRHHLCSSGAALSFVLERLSNTPARTQEPSPSVEPCEGCCEQAMQGRSLGALTWLGAGVALAWRTPGGALPPLYQWRRPPLRARAPEYHSGTPQRAISINGRRPWQAAQQA